MEKDISYVAFESVCARFERTIKRLWILIIILIVLFVGTNGAWIWYESQWEYIETTEVNQDVLSTDGDNVIVSGTGDISYGESETDGNQN
jgi:hypothetical protein